MEPKVEAPLLQVSLTRSQLVTVACIAAIISVSILRAYFLKDYIFSKLLMSDDTIFIGSYMFGAPVPGPKAQQAYYGVLEFLSSGGSEIPSKLFLFAIQAVLAVCSYLVIVRFSRAPLIAAGLAILVATYPVSPDQNYFMSGAHPAAATSVYFIFCVLFVESLFRDWIFHRIGYLAFLIGQGVLLYICGMSSPTFTLMPAILVLTTLLTIVVAHGEKLLSIRSIGLLVLSALPMLAYYLTVRHHHYGGMVGWTNMSSVQVFKNLSASLELIFERPFENNIILLAGYVTGLSVILLAVIVSVARHLFAFIEKVDAKFIVVMIVLLASAAFTFGPSSVVTIFTTRYVAAPSLIAFLALAVLSGELIRRVRSISSAHLLPIRMGVLLLAVVSVTHNIGNTRSELEPYLQSHALIRDKLADVRWKSGDQALVLMPEGHVVPTAGYNHWSTWYLRVLTGVPNMIGLVGTRAMGRDIKASDVFVEQYRDHDPEYWGVANGRSYRKRMKGLERDRPLHVFAPSETGAMAARPLLYWHEDSLLFVEEGKSPDEARDVTSADALCTGSDPARSLILVGKPDVGALGDFRPLSQATYSARGSDHVLSPVPVPPSGLVWLNVNIVSEDTLQAPPSATEYSQTFPPMPIMGPDFSAYLVNGTYRILSKNQGGAQASVPASEGKPLNVSLVGCRGGNAMLLVDDVFAGVIPNATFSGDWTLGKGFYQRYWTGEVTDFSLNTLSRRTE
jgi:hypothetical protein